MQIYFYIMRIYCYIILHVKKNSVIKGILDVKIKSVSLSTLIAKFDLRSCLLKQTEDIMPWTNISSSEKILKKDKPWPDDT